MAGSSTQTMATVGTMRRNNAWPLTSDLIVFCNQGKTSRRVSWANLEMTKRSGGLVREWSLRRNPSGSPHEVARGPRPQASTTFLKVQIYIQLQLSTVPDSPTRHTSMPFSPPAHTTPFAQSKLRIFLSPLLFNGSFSNT